MRKFTAILIGIATTFLTVAPMAFAVTSVNISNNEEGSRSTVDVKTNTGSNTVCVNGKCTTSSGERGKSTVCVNGKCETSDGDMHVQSEGASAEVNISKDGNSSVNIQQNTNGSLRSKVEVNQAVEGTSVSVEKKAEKKSSEKTELEDSKKFDIKEFVSEKLKFLRDIVTFKFLFGDK